MNVVISGLGHLSALGQGLASLREGLGRSLFAPNHHEKIQTAAGEKDVHLYRAPDVDLPHEFPESVRRRMPRVSKMCVATGIEAIDDSIGRSRVGQSPERVGLVVGSAFGPLDQTSTYHLRVFKEGPAGASPSSFAASVHNSIASHLSISLGIRGPVSTVTSMEQTTIGSLRVAYDWILSDVADHVLVVIGDELSEFHRYLMAHLPSSDGLRARSNDCSVVGGEGFAALVLSREDQAPKTYAQIESVELCPTRPPGEHGCLVATYGRKGQWAQYSNWLGREPKSHSQLYGSMITGTAFEVVIAALLVAQDRKPTSCVQLSDRGEAQALTLR